MYTLSLVTRLVRALFDGMDDWHALADRFEMLEKIGEGTFGVVFKARALDGPSRGEIVALKQIRLESGDCDGVSVSALREISTLRELQHPTIVTLHGVLHRPGYLVLVFEFVDMDLLRYLGSKPDGIGEPLAKSYLRQLLEGIHYCHVRRILHRDLKPQNLLINERGEIKIADFGLARTISVPLRPFTKEVVTQWYRAPEVLLGAGQYSSPLDLWSIGCIFAEMLTSRPLFPGDSEIDQLYRIFRTLGTPTEATWPGVTALPDYRPTFPKWPRQALAHSIRHLGGCAAELLELMLTYDPQKRITAAEALRHPFLVEK
eukprot:m.137540 g.137540  ORF g.137540 m.137540 type:complete len:317 (+) comp9572_c0_seq1:766-1716(+)